MDRNSKERKTKINCFHCIYLQITWQPKYPYACKAMGFKSAIIPSLEVFRAAGSNCKQFTKKKNEGSNK